MEIHQINLSWRLPRVGNFTKAAKRCHVTQPALSSAMNQLNVRTPTSRPLSHHRAVCRCRPSLFALFFTVHKSRSLFPKSSTGGGLAR